MSDSSKLTEILDEAFDKPWDKYSDEEYKQQLEETKSKVRELTPEQALKMMNKRMNLRIQVTAIYKKDRRGRALEENQSTEYHIHGAFRSAALLRVRRV